MLQQRYAKLVFSEKELKRWFAGATLVQVILRNLVENAPSL